MTQFTQPVSMQVTIEQYDKDLKEPLEILGYNQFDIGNFSYFEYLMTNFGPLQDRVGNLSKDQAQLNGRYFIDHYNPELFLAIAAMTNEQFGIVGEYWKCTSVTNTCFTNNKIYKAYKSLNEERTFIDDTDEFNGYALNNITRFIKATKEELIELFTKKEPIMTKVDRTINIKCANQEEFNSVIKWLRDNNEEIFCNCMYANGAYPIIYYMEIGMWSSNLFRDNFKTPQELGIINNTLNQPLNRLVMQTLTRKQLVDLHNEFECSDFKKVIAEILKSNPISLDYTLFRIDEKYITQLNKEGSTKQKEAVTKLGIKLVMDKTVDTRNTVISSMIGNRDCGQYQNTAFYLSYEYNWEIKKDILGLLCLIPTKK